MGGRRSRGVEVDGGHDDGGAGVRARFVLQRRIAQTATGGGRGGGGGGSGDPVVRGGGIHGNDGRRSVKSHFARECICVLTVKKVEKSTTGLGPKYKLISEEMGEKQNDVSPTDSLQRAIRRILPQV